MEITLTVKGTRKEFDNLFLKANVRFGEYKDSTYTVTLRLPEFNDKKNPYRYYRITTIRGLMKKLERHGHLISQVISRRAS